MDEVSRNTPVQGLASDSVAQPLDTGRSFRPWPNWQTIPIHDTWRYPMPMPGKTTLFRGLFNSGPKAPKRKRPKRVAKKIAKRGGMLRTRGLVQTYYRRWPWLLWASAAPRKPWYTPNFSAIYGDFTRAR